MSYVKTNWINDQTRLNADNLNNIENGIVNNEAQIGQNAAAIAGNAAALEDVNATLELKANKSDLTTVYRYKSTVATYADLPATAENGDIYNVLAAYTDGEGHEYPAGQNYAWKDTGWDPLGGSFDFANKVGTGLAYDTDSQKVKLSDDLYASLEELAHPSIIPQITEPSIILTPAAEGYAEILEIGTKLISLLLTVTPNKGDIYPLYNSLGVYLAEHADYAGDVTQYTIMGAATGNEGLDNSITVAEKIITAGTNALTATASFAEGVTIPYTSKGVALPNFAANFKSASVTITGKYKIYYGIAAAGVYDESFIKALSANQLKLPSEGHLTTIADNAEGSDNYLFYAYPAHTPLDALLFATPIFKESGDIVSFELVASDVEYTIDGTTTSKYNIYKTYQKGLNFAFDVE